MCGQWLVWAMTRRGISGAWVWSDDGPSPCGVSISDRASAGVRAAATARALLPTAEAKQQAWDAAVRNLKLSNGLMRAVIAGSDQPSDLAVLAKEAKNRSIADLFSSLAEARDVITMKVGASLKVDPVAPYIGKAPDAEKTLQVQPYDDNGKRLSTRTLQMKDVSAVRSYEENALTQVEGFLAKKEVPRLEMLLAAEEALGTVLHYQVRAREKNVRKGDE